LSIGPVKEFAREESEHVKERQNLIQVLEQELRKELVVEIHDENLDFEVDKDRARSQFLNEDGDLTDSKVTTLTLSQKHFYLEFETSQTVFKSLKSGRHWQQSSMDTSRNRTT
jgi:hypothetical protein